jgi:hypothetical protein
VTRHPTKGNGGICGGALSLVYFPIGPGACRMGTSGAGTLGAPRSGGPRSLWTGEARRFWPGPA